MQMYRVVLITKRGNQDHLRLRPLFVSPDGGLIKGIYTEK